jgi:hypothetical protein
MTSSAIFIYALKSIALSAICFGYYTAFLKNTLMHQYNRFYLLATLLLSLFGPLIKFDFLLVSEEQAANISQSMIYLNSIQIQPKVEQTDWNQIAFYIAIGISLMLVAYLALGIYKIYQIKRAHPVTSHQGIEIVETNLENAPFSFLNLLFWKQSIEFASEHGQKIFQHELAHIKQKHTYDRLFCQFASSIAWFNPFHWLISKELQNIHEFIADREAIQNGDIQGFAKMLLQAHYGNEFLNPSHSFYYSSLKRRIMLLTTSKNPKFAYLRRLAVLPIAACALILCSIQIHAQAKKAKKAAKTDFLVSIQPDSTIFSDPKTGKKVFAVATRDMPPPPAPASVPSPPTPPENQSKFVKGISVDSNNFEIKSTINGKVVTVTSQIVTNGTKVNGKLISMKTDSVTFLSVPSEKIKALIVIDGVIVKDLDLNKINPQTIESMNVLKGEKAQEKYGKSGANGVVEIITKKQ